MVLARLKLKSRLGTLWDQGKCNQFCSVVVSARTNKSNHHQLCSKEELWEAARDEEMKIPWQAVNEGPPVTEEQYQERF
jgi:hypothetical protein